MTRPEKTEIHGLLMIGRGYSLQVLADAEARGDDRQAAMTRRNLAKADKAITILENELVATQAN